MTRFLYYGFPWEKKAYSCYINILCSVVCLYKVCIINKVYIEFGLLISLSYYIRFYYKPGKNDWQAMEESIVLPAPSGRDVTWKLSIVYINNAFLIYIQVIIKQKYGLLISLYLESVSF